MRQAEFNLVALPFLAIGMIMTVALTGCGQDRPPSAPTEIAIAAQQEKKQAEEEVIRLTKFLQLCNAADNGGVAKFVPQHSEPYGRSSRWVSSYIECKNGLGASYQPAPSKD